MERVVSDLFTYLCTQNLISRQHHCFLFGKSRTANRTDSLCDCSIAIIGKHPVNIAFIDFNKAVDVMCHSELLRKLEVFGINVVEKLVSPGL